jgi:hypothetical protein
MIWKSSWPPQPTEQADRRTNTRTQNHHGEASCPGKPNLPRRKPGLAWMLGRPSLDARSAWPILAILAVRNKILKMWNPFKWSSIGPKFCRDVPGDVYLESIPKRSGNSTDRENSGLDWIFPNIPQNPPVLCSWGIWSNQVTVMCYSTYPTIQSVPSTPKKEITQKQVKGFRERKIQCKSELRSTMNHCFISSPISSDSYRGVINTVEVWFSTPWISFTTNLG